MIERTSLKEHSVQEETLLSDDEKLLISYLLLLKKEIIKQHVFSSLCTVVLYSVASCVMDEQL